MPIGRRSSILPVLEPPEEGFLSRGGEGNAALLVSLAGDDDGDRQAIQVADVL